MNNLKYALQKILITHLSDELKGGVQIRMGKYHDILFRNLNQEMQEVATRSRLLTDSRLNSGNSKAVNWRNYLFQDVRYMLGIGRETCRSDLLLQVATESRTTPTLLPTREQQFLIIDDLTKLRDDNNDPSFSVSPKTAMFFSKKDMKRAILMANVDFDSTMKINIESYAFDPVQECAKRLGIYEQFNFEVYKNDIITTISAKELRVLHALNDEELYSKVLSFMEENYSTLKTDDYDTFIKATYLRVFTIWRQGSTLNDITMDVSCLS